MYDFWSLHAPCLRKFCIHLVSYKMPINFKLGGVLTYLAEWGCAALMVALYKKSLNMGPVFYQKILKHESTFLIEPKFLGFRMAKTQKIVKFSKNGPSFKNNP